MAKRNAFITVKDHKDNFPANVKCRLINPAKSDLGKVSKIILDNINNEIRSITKVNQWKNTKSVTDWFKSIEGKSKYTFLSFDIVDFYPSIKEDLLDATFQWARTMIDISDDEINITKHARKSL